jgi:serine/threonine protein kinase
MTHMAPETLMSGQISRASDVYAYGIMLWELYTGADSRLILIACFLLWKLRCRARFVLFVVDASSCLRMASCCGSCTQVGNRAGGWVIRAACV